MTTTSLSVKIANVEYATLAPDRSFSLPDKIEERSTCQFTILDKTGIYAFKKGQSVVVTDALEGIIFSGIVQSVKRTTNVWPQIYHEITCTDKVATIDAHTSNKIYTGQYAGAIAVDQVKDEWVNGITATFAVDTDTTQADFSTGTLSGLVAASNVADGDLELAPAGATVTITENTTAVFGNGTLTNMTASNNSLGPSATTAMKIQATQSVQGVSNSYTYVKFWSGSITVVSGRYLTYDLWITSSSPEAKIGIDLVFSDGTTLRDNAISNNGQYFDGQNKGPHPNVDLKGLAVDAWYHRSFLMDNFSGKTISYAMIAVEGDSSGTYTGYIKNVVWLDSGGTNHGTFFSGSLNVSPPQQMLKTGYGTTSVMTVNTYDCNAANRVSPSYSIDLAKILKSSFLTYTTSLPTGYSFSLQYSIDGGNSYTTCTNNAALPALLAGLNTSGKSIQFLASFTQGAGADPTQQPLLTSMQVMIYSSYAATKTDINQEYTTNAQWNGGTHTNTQASNNILSPFGAIQNYDAGNQLGTVVQTLYGGGATGPNTATTCYQYVDSKQFRLQLHQSTEARSRIDFAGQWADFQMEFDVNVDNTNMKVGCVYRTTGWSNYDGTFAYGIEIIGTTIKLFKGSNNGGASSNAAVTQVGSTATVNLTSQAMHRIKVVVSGSSHQIYFDDTLAISATDSTYTAAGNVGFRISNTDASNGYIGTFDNFGISITNVFSGANWTSQSISLTSAATYLNSVVQWQDISTDPTQVINNLWASFDGGSTWHLCTNGGALPTLTAGQSLSGVSLILQMLFSYNTSTVLPQIQDLTLYVVGGFSSSGTRISKALLLSNVGTCGSTLVFWNAVQPANTSITIATSLDGTTYTSIANGGSISGLNQQPVPTIDTFNLITSANYTSTARTGGTSTTGWLWDVANSRMSVSGGTNALLLYGGISTKDVDIVFDLDEADQAGVVWRWTDASNFYELDIFDSSSSAGATNIMRLFKVVANTKTQIGSDLPITLVRGSIVKRARVVMIGTAITVYFDGTLALSTTDSSLAGPGEIGFIEVSGIARFYNLRIQPQGDNLSGKFVYVKQTLTSTDPTVTPQITDITTLVTNPNIAAGSLIGTADYTNTYKSDNIKDLAKQSNYYWNIKADGSFIFLPRETLPAPWVLTNRDILPDSMEVEDTADLYRNRQTLLGVQSTLSTNETKIGDGKTTSWALKYNVVSVSSVTLNGQTKTIGIKGVDTGKDFYYEVGGNSIAQDSSGTVLQQTDSLLINYTGQSTTTVTRDNTGQFANTISQSQYISYAGISVPIEVVLNQASATKSTNANSDDLDVSLLKRIAVDINVTAQSGTNPTVQFFIDRKGLDGIYYPIWQSSVVASVLKVVSTTIGPKCLIGEVLGFAIRVRWTIGGTASPSSTFSISIQGRVDPSLASLGIVEAVEDVSSQNLTVVAAQALGDSRLQQYGAIGRTFKFKTRRTGLAVGQYLSVFLSNMSINDASMLITSIQRTQQFKITGGAQDMTYIFDVEATENANLTSWGRTLNNALAGVL